MPNELKKIISYENAVSILPDEEYIHTFRVAAFGLCGADWSRAEILDKLAVCHPIHLAFLLYFHFNIFFPKRKLAITPDQMMAIKNLYEPLLPLPPIGCHKILAAQLKMDEWRVHVGIKLVRAQMGLDRWNEDRADKPADYMVAKHAPKTEEAPVDEEAAVETAVEETVAPATEAAKEVISYGFEFLDLKRIEAGTFIDNYQSQKVCEKIGFVKEGVARNGYVRYDGKIFDKLICVAPVYLPRVLFFILF